MKKIGAFVFILIIAISLSGCKKDGGGTPTKPAVTPIGVNDGTAATQTIGAAGGTIISSDGEMELIIPAGALATNTAITLQPITNNAPNGRRKAYRCTPDGLQFAKDITVKFHYTEMDLAATKEEYMMMAFQTADGMWQVINNITNNTASRVISASIDHFTDFTAFDIMRIEPADLYLNTNETGNFRVTATGMSDLNAVIVLTELLERPETWQVNGITGGNDEVGRIAPNGDNTLGVYTSPASAPNPNPVTISATVNIPFTIDGQRFNQGILTARAHIIGNKYKVDIESVNDIAVGTGEIFQMKDHLRFTVNLIGDSGTVSDIQNSFPTFLKTANSTNGCTTTFDLEGTGPMNPRDADVANITYSSFSKDVYVTFGTNHPLIRPIIRKTCQGQNPQVSTLGIWDFSGAVVTFKDNGQVQKLESGVAGQKVFFTFTPLQ